MGLANSAVVKGFVDFLTNLLNLVNNLTNAFGSGVGSALKWGTVIATIMGGRALFKTGGLMDTLLSGMLGNTLGRQNNGMSARQARIAAFN
jgi:hypothetical protein